MPVEGVADDAPPPHDEPAERLVLCGLLRAWPLAFREIARVGLGRDDLYLFRHRLVWDAVVGLENAGTPVSAWECWRRLGVMGAWAEWGTDFGCARWLVDLLEEDPTGMWAMAAAVSVRDAAVRRAVIHRARRLLRDAWAGVPVAELTAT
ncbi:MAG: hypothetical protein U0804_02640 [Gemmataceae bacterium]